MIEQRLQNLPHPRAALISAPKTGRFYEVLHRLGGPKEALALLSEIFSANVGKNDLSIGEAIDILAYGPETEMSPDEIREIDTMLREWGINYHAQSRSVRISTNHPGIGAMLADTEYPSGWSRRLLEHPAAVTGLMASVRRDGGTATSSATSFFETLEKAAEARQTFEKRRSSWPCLQKAHPVEKMPAPEKASTAPGNEPAQPAHANAGGRGSELRAPTPVELRRIYSALESYFDEVRGRYVSGFDDARIAAELSLPRLMVVRVRRDAFGEIRATEALLKLEEQLEKAQEALRKANAAFEAARGEVARIESEIAVEKEKIGA